MWYEKKRLFLLIGAVAVLAVAYLLIHGLPGSGDEDEEMTPRRRRAAARGAAPSTDPSNPGPRAKRPAGAKWSPAEYQRLVTISRSPEPEDLPELREATRSTSPEVREAAVVGMSRLGEKADTQTLIERLKTDTAPPVRAAAAAALGKARCWEAGPALIQALEDKDSNVRTRAGAALRRIMGIDFRYRADDPGRQKAIQRIREWWPKFYDGHVQSASRKG